MQLILIVTNAKSIDDPKSEVSKSIKKATSSKGSKSRPQKLAKSLNTSDDGDDDIRSKSKSKVTSSQGKSQGKSWPVYVHPSVLNCQKRTPRTNQRKNPLPRKC